MINKTTEVLFVCYWFHPDICRKHFFFFEKKAVTKLKQGYSCYIPIVLNLTLE